MPERGALDAAGVAPRRPYSPPTITRVPLRPDEVVLGTCKTTTAVAKNVGPFARCTVPSPCRTPGS